jgi:sirohydrochlorin ferrochelatase
MPMEDSTTGIILFAHGSAVEEANRGVHELARKVAAAGLYRYVRAAFLELGQPDLSTAIREAAQAELRRVVVVPYFLTLGVHLRRDLPRLIAAAKQTFPDFEIEVGAPLEGHPLMPSLILDRVREALTVKRALE